MRHLKRIFVFILSMALCASLLTVASAKNNNHHNDDDDNQTTTVLSADVQTLIDLGLLLGADEHGVTDAYAKSKPTRIQAFIVYLRLIHALPDFEQYIYHDDDDNFSDHHGHSGFVQKGMAFAKAHPEFNWIGSNGKFNPMAHLTAKEYAKVLLMVLGYTIPEDFTWSTVESFAEGLGLNVPEGDFTFEQFATMTVQALNMYMKGSTTQKLIDLLELSPSSDTTPPTVSDVILSTPYTAGPPIVNGKVTVYFSEAINTDTLKNLANYAVDLDGSASTYTSTLLSTLTGASATVSADRKSVVLTIPGSALTGGAATGAGVTDITISNMKDSAGNVMVTATTFVRTAASLTISAAPAAIAVNKLQVTFSNPMKTINAAEFKLYKADGVTQVAVGKEYTLDATSKVATITLNTNLTADAKADGAAVKLAIGTAQTKDIFGNTVSGDVAVAVSASTPATVVVTDKIVPSVTSLVKGTAPYTFELTFTEPVNAFDLTNALKITNMSGTAQTATYSYSGSAGTITSFTKLTATITGAYENKYAVELLSQGIKDLSGNIVKALPKTTLTVVTDGLPVIIAKETQDLDKDGYLDAVKLTFSEAVKDSTVTAANFDVAGYTGEGFNAAAAGDTADNAVIYITFTEAGTPDTGATPTITYTQGTLEDLSGNKLATTTALATTDKAAPVVINPLTKDTTLTAGGTTSSATLVLSEVLKDDSKTAVVSAIKAPLTTNDIGTNGVIAVTYVWTAGTLTVTVTANTDDSDNIVLAAASADLIDIAGNTTTAAQIVK